MGADDQGNTKFMLCIKANVQKTRALSGAENGGSTAEPTVDDDQKMVGTMISLEDMDDLF